MWKFFTTKERGKGTGLGLSTAYGVARQSGGTVTVSSTQDQGSAFTVWLPATEDAPMVASGAFPAVSESGGYERVLLVDEDPQALLDRFEHFEPPERPPWRSGA